MMLCAACHAARFDVMRSYARVDIYYGFHVQGYPIFQCCFSSLSFVHNTYNTFVINFMVFRVFFSVPACAMLVIPVPSHSTYSGLVEMGLVAGFERPS